MKKRFVLLLALLTLLPVMALAELNYEVKSTHYIYFPDMHRMTAFFKDAESWIFVTPENLDEHLDMVLARGGTEEEIRERYARESFMFEAYSDLLPADACIRVEFFHDDLTREAWHARHLDATRSEKFFGAMDSGMYIPWYDIFSGHGGSNSETAAACAYCTSTALTTFESGYMILQLINGRMYLVTYAVHGRLIETAYHISRSSEAQYCKNTPVYSNITFDEAALPQMPAFSLKNEMPIQADIGDLPVSGTIRSGGSIKVTLDGEEVPVKLDSYSGKFSLVLPLTAEGDREVVFTVTHPRNTDRVETYTINVSGARTSLQFTALPQDVVYTGEQVISGISDPGAEISIILDENEPVIITADETGAFSYTFTLKDHALHHLEITATAPENKDPFKLESQFITEFEIAINGVNAFRSKMNDIKLKDICADPEAYLGERVMIKAQTLDYELFDGGIGLYCKEFNEAEYYDRYYSGTPLYFYVTTSGYGRGLPLTHAASEIYGVVTGTHEYDGKTVPLIEMHYGIYRDYGR